MFKKNDNQVWYERGFDDGFIAGTEVNLGKINDIFNDYIDEFHTPHNKLTICIRCDLVAAVRVAQDRVMRMYD